MSWENEINLSDVGSAGPVISDRIGRDVASHLDLEEALEASRYSSHPYSTHPREWPPLVEVLDTWELPPVLVEKYNAAGGEGTALCGIFPEIRRAWASVDNTLFMWRYDKWDGQCPEYSGEEEAICAVGLVKAKPGIFVEAIQYLLILATPVEIILVGVCCSRKGDGTDPFAEVSLQTLPQYNIQSDGVTMTSVACTDRGHIFLAGRDGHIYELQYTTGSGWQKHCRKVCLTAGLEGVISRWLLPSVFKFGAVDPIVEMVVDNERQTLYARTEEMKIQVYSLGPNGDGPLKKVAEERNLISKDLHYGGRQSSGARTNRSTKTSIVCISPLSTLESKWIHLVAVLSDGRRMYLSTTQSSGNNGSVGALGGFSNSHQKPSCLKVVTTRPPPPIGVGGGLAFGPMSLASRSHNDDLSLKIESAYYAVGTLVLSDSSPSTVSSLLIVNRDSTTQSSSGNLGTGARTSKALRESISSLPIEGRMLFVADISPMPEAGATLQSLYSQLEFLGYDSSMESCERLTEKIWARGELQTQHILPRRKIVVFSTMGMMEIVFNRPVDILKRLLESSSPRSILEDFFNRFGAGEAAAMCLMIAARIVQTENLISNVVAEKAAEAFEDPRIVGIPQLEGSSGLSNTRTAASGFSMGQVVQEANPVFSGAYEGLSLCSSRILLPLWEFPVMVSKSEMTSSDGMDENGIIVCRLSIGAMQVLEEKIRSLERFLKSRRNQRRGLYGCVAGFGDLTGSILIGMGSDLGASDRSMVRNLFGPYSRNVESNEAVLSNKRQRLPYSSAELASFEVRAIECIRQLLLRCGEALFLLQLLSQHHVTRLVQGFDGNIKRALVQLTFHQLVCSEEGDRLATQLVSALMEYYTGPDGRGTVDDISGRLRDGCPSYYKESDYKFYLAVERLERAVATPDKEERESLAREAFSYLSKVPESADLRTVCKRFEDLRFYEAVVRLPLQKAQAVDPAGDASNEHIDAAIREYALAQREQCYEIITSALRALKGDVSQRELRSPIRPVAQSTLDPASRKRYICQIVQLGVQSPDRVFHDYLYRTLINLGLEKELLEFGGPDVVPFLQSACREPLQEVRAASAITSLASSQGHSRVSVPSNQAKYFELLAQYYVMKRQHVLAAHVLLRLAERRSANDDVAPTLEQRRQYLTNAVLQAKSANDGDGVVGSSRSALDDGLLDLLEGKLTVLQFQIKIKDELEAIGSRLEASINPSEPVASDVPPDGVMYDANLLRTAREKAKELSLELRSITQLYNEYAVPFELWEICLEMLYFANYSGDADSSIVRETWARLLDQALSNGGIAEACSVLKRVGSHIYPGDVSVLPLDTLCLHLEKASLKTGKTFEVLKLQLPVIDIPSLKVVFEDRRTYASPAAVSVKESLWQSLEEDMVPSLSAVRSSWLQIQSKLVPTKAKDSNVCVAGEAIAVDIGFRNPLQISLSVSCISLVCEHSSIPEEGEKDAKSSTSEVHNDEDRKISVTSEELSSVTTLFTATEVDVSLGGGETIMVQLKVTPRVEGALKIVGVRWKLSGSVVGFHNFQSDLLNKKVAKGRRKTKQSPIDDLSFLVIKSLPKLESFVHHLPKTVSAGDLQRLTLELRNPSEIPVKNMKMKISHPRFLSVGNPEVLSMEFPACLEKKAGYAKCDGDVKSIASDKLFLFPEDTEIHCKNPLLWPLWLWAATPGKFSFHMSIYYETGDISSIIRYRTLRIHHTLEVLPSLDVSFQISPCPSKLQEYLVRMNIVNQTRLESFKLHQLSAVGKEWEISLFQPIDTVFPSEVLMAGQALSCFFKLKNKKSETAENEVSSLKTLEGATVRLSHGSNEPVFDTCSSPLIEFHHHERVYQKAYEQEQQTVDFILISRPQRSNDSPGQPQTNAFDIAAHYACHCRTASSSPVCWLMDGPRIIHHNFSSSLCEIKLRLTIYNSSEVGVSVRISTSDSIPSGSLSTSSSVLPANEAGWHDMSLTNEIKVTSSIAGSGAGIRRSTSPECVPPFIWSGASSTCVELEPRSTTEVPLLICVFSPGIHDLSNYALHWNILSSADYKDAEAGERVLSGTCDGHPYYLTVLQHE